MAKDHLPAFLRFISIKVNLRGRWAVALRPFQWLPHRSARYAIPVELKPGDQGKTLCGLEIATPRLPPPRFPDGCWPECPACDDRWPEHEGIPPRRARVPRLS
ncbi:zinc finger protein [Lentzea sp. DG1S-22]|uniref:zinc finger protein n=1 Tax=Lentzea sp. DG1S-22 TaxID=3108822 RepID=UPI002E79D88D|nr:zinc finger protein [Lentzea sp. DG1S-22]WVH83107.1 zinc finger protein [Lentzea sp. DG1S-22]